MRNLHGMARWPGHDACTWLCDVLKTCVGMMIMARWFEPHILTTQSTQRGPSFGLAFMNAIGGCTAAAAALAGHRAC